jgi:hypothetical protein
VRRQDMKERDVGVMEGCFLEGIAQSPVRWLRKIGWEQYVCKGMTLLLTKSAHQ